MKIKRIISSFCLAVTIFSLVEPIGYAVDESAGEVIDTLQQAGNFLEWWYKAGSSVGNYLHSLVDEDVCPHSPASGADRRHNFVGSYTSYSGKYGYYNVCEYCGRLAHEVASEAYDDYVSTLDSPIIYAGQALSLPLRPDDSTQAALDQAVTDGYVLDYEERDNYLLYRIGKYTTSYNSSRYDFWSRTMDFVSSPFTVADGNYTFACDGIEGYGYYHTFPYSGSNLFYVMVLQKYTDGKWQNSDYLSVASYNYQKIDTGEYIKYVYPAVSKQVSLVSGIQYRFYIRENATDLRNENPAYYTGYHRGVKINGVSLTPVSASSSPVNPPANTRPSYITNNTTNVYIGAVDNSNTIINLYGADVFNESTRTFTEPVTGEQYLCTDWQYNYESNYRGYMLDLADGTYSYSGTGIKSLALLYLDDALYIVGFNDTAEFGENADSLREKAVFMDRYVYVVDTSEPHTHVYTSEVTQAPTCNNFGVVTYTCTGCGEQYTQTMAALGHDWELVEETTNEYDEDGNLVTQGYKLYRCTRCETEYRTKDDTPPPDTERTDFFTWFREAWQHFRDWYSSLDFSNIGSGGGSGGKHTHTYSEEVIKEATCTVSGSVRYTCVECGDSYTEVIEPLEHDYAASETVPDKYTFPDGVTCPNGSGHSLTHELDGEVYHVTCSDCGEEFDVDAVFEYGYTVYTCTRCGEQYTESNREKAGLFDAIGDFVADGINWVADKLEQLVDAFSGISDIFDRFSGTLEESTGEYPALFAEIVAVMPEDLMAVIWFAVIGAFAVAAWRKWFG